MSYNFAIHATCLVALTLYKYSELQVSSTVQKLSCKASYKTCFFLTMIGLHVCGSQDIIKQKKYEKNSAMPKYKMSLSFISFFFFL